MLAWHHFAFVVTEPAVSPDEVAVTTIEPAAPVDCTMAKALPLKAFRAYDEYAVKSIGSPLSVPASLPGPDTAKVMLLFAVGTITPAES